MNESYFEQYDLADVREIQAKNTSTIHSAPVLRQARYEVEKSERGGDNLYESAKTFMDSEVTDYSQNFPQTETSKRFPGLVRDLSCKPFTATLATYDQLLITADYLNQSDERTVLFMDSSGNHLKRTAKKLLTTSLCRASLVPDTST